MVTYPYSSTNVYPNGPIVGSDDSIFYPQFELSHKGEPVCINEYAARIAQGKSTHVI